MAKFVITDPVVTFAGSTVTTSAASVTIELESDDIETTNFGGSGWRTRVGGLKQGTVSIDFHSDYGSGAIDSLVWSNFGGTVAVTVTPTAGTAVSATNPKWSFDVLVNSYATLGAVGDLATFSLQLPITGAVTRGTTA